MIKTRRYKALLKLLMIQNNIIKKIGLPQFYDINNNLLSGEVLQVFKQESWENSNKTMSNYKLFMWA